MTPRTGVMICGHGSRSVAAVNEFNTLAHHLRRRLPEYDVDSGFLEFARPMIRDGLDALRDRGGDLLCLFRIDQRLRQASPTGFASHFFDGQIDALS